MKRLNKLKRKSGFTLAETLLAVLILLPVSGIVETGIHVARNIYQKVVIGANAQALLSTLPPDHPAYQPLLSAINNLNSVMATNPSSEALAVAMGNLTLAMANAQASAVSPSY